MHFIYIFTCFMAFLALNVGSEKHSSARTEKCPHKCVQKCRESTLIVNLKLQHNATNHMCQSKEYYFSSVHLRWRSCLVHITRVLGHQLTYVIWLFCHVVPSNYFSLVNSLGCTICAFFIGLIVARLSQ